MTMGNNTEWHLKPCVWGHTCAEENSSNKGPPLPEFLSVHIPIHFTCTQQTHNLNHPIRLNKIVKDAHEDQMPPGMNLP